MTEFLGVLAYTPNRGAEDVLAVVTALLDWLQDPQQTNLRRAFTVWIQRVILADSSDAAREPLIELDEVRTMLAQQVQQWKQEWRAEGLAEGLAEGRAEGLTEGLAKGVQNERATLIRQARLRFDTNTADALAPLLESVNDPEQLTQIGEGIILCASGEELLDRVRTLAGASH